MEKHPNNMNIYIVERVTVGGFNEDENCEIMRAFTSLEEAKKFVESQKDFYKWDCDGCLDTMEKNNIFYSITKTNLIGDTNKT